MTLTIGTGEQAYLWPTREAAAFAANKWPHAIWHKIDRSLRILQRGQGYAISIWERGKLQGWAVLAELQPTTPQVVTVEPASARIAAKISAIRSMVEELAEDAREAWENVGHGDPDEAALTALQEGLEAIAGDLADLEPEPEEDEA